jgi:VanZ family protein
MSTRFALLLAWLAFIVYGSLVPLDFRPLPWDQAWARFQALPFLNLGVESRADWIANGVLYVPLGVLAAQALAPRWGRWGAAPLAWLGCAAVALAVEFAQLFFPPRTVSQNDLLAEALGAALGVLAAPWLQARAQVLARSAQQHRALWALGLLQVYAAAYLLGSFFPYDLLLSAQEWRDRLQGTRVDWVLVTDRGLGVAWLRLAVEAALALPLGVLVAWLFGWRGRAAWVGGLASGLALGGLVELGQLALASGVSQGASVLSRGLGMALGAAAAVPLARHGLTGLRRGLARWGRLALPAYLALLLFASGWMRAAWHGPEAAGLVLQDLRWVPFYYHYYTTEAKALYSLGMVVLMYAPLAALAWARHRTLGTTVGAVSLLALVVEAGKLFVPGQRPDPTNLLIVAATAWAVWMGLQALASPPPSAPAAPPPAGPRADGAGRCAPVSAVRGRAPSALGGVAAALLAAVLALGVAAGVAMTPLPTVGAVWLALLLAGVALACWLRPLTAVALVLAGLPLLDLTPWTGPRWVDAFDLLLVTALGSAGLRLATRAAVVPVPGRGGTAALRFGPWALALLAGAATTLAAGGHWTWPGHAAWHSGWTALALVKAALWAWAFVALLGRLDRAGQDWAGAVGAGMRTGLAGVVLWVLWERHVFAGLTDFAAEYRVTGPFSAMHRGGAFIECYLATASAFALQGLWQARRGLFRLGALLLLAGAVYAVMVTFSRNGYAALVLVLLLGLTGLARASAWTGAADDLNRPPPVPAPSGASRWTWGLGAVLAIAGVATAVLGAGGFARERLAGSWADLQTRQAHWQDAIAMRSPGLGPALLGEGLGRFPELHFWRSAERTRAASFQHLADADRMFLRLGPGATLYVEQVLRLPTAGPLVLELELRGRSPAPSLDVALCEKSTLTSRRCVIGQAATPQDAAPERWHRVRLALASDRLDAPPPPRGPQVKFSLLTPRGDGTLDVARVRLLAPDGRNLLANGDFAHGLQRWAWSTDVHPPWHVDNLPVHVWLEQGWLGAAAWAWLLLGALAAGAAAAWQGRARLPVAWAALAGFLASGLLNTLVDEPRFLWLLLLYAWWALQRTPPARRGGPGPAGGAAT